MAKKRKARYFATYGEEWLRNIEGTKRAIINRLKRASYTQMVDSLVIFPNDEDGATDFDNPVYDAFDERDDFFSDAELSEVFGWQSLP